MKRLAILLLSLVIVLSLLPLTGCEALKKAVNDKTKETQNIDLNLTPSWVPLAAATIGGQEYSAVCYKDATSIDTVISATDYKDVWNDIKKHLSEVNIKKLTYQLAKNHATKSGEILLYIVTGDIPNAIAQYPGLPLVFVKPSALSQSDLVASVPVHPGTNIPDWTNVTWEGDGKSNLEKLLVDYEQSFHYCLDLNIDPESVSSLSDIQPMVKIMLHLNADVVFVPLS